MRQDSRNARVNNAAKLARKIITLPPGEIPALIRKMLLERKLSRSVIALDEMIRKQPKLKESGIKASSGWGCGGKPSAMLPITARALSLFYPNVLRLSRSIQVWRRYRRRNSAFLRRSGIDHLKVVGDHGRLGDHC